MIEEHWKRISGIHVTESGDVAAVWIAHDKDTDTLHLYHCAVLRHQPPAVIVEGLNALGRYMPIAWEAGAKPTEKMLTDRGVNMLVDPLKEDDALSEVTSREIEERMLTGRFKVNKRLSEWRAEYKTFFRDETQVPRDSHPLMAATRYAVAQLEWARPLRKKRSKKADKNYPKLAIV